MNACTGNGALAMMLIAVSAERTAAPLNPSLSITTAMASIQAASRSVVARSGSRTTGEGTSDPRPMMGARESWVSGLL
ncbi:MAG: hypothetical protein U0269_29000 [Polyangiales bacterium]